MKLEDVEYFSAMKQLQPKVFQLAQRVFDASLNNPNDGTEMQRRLLSLSKSKGAEHLRQGANFVAELVAFDDLENQELSPHWVPESNAKGVKMPDIERTGEGRKLPVEVKHINDPHDEHEATYAGQSVGGSVQLDYSVKLEIKVRYLVNDAKEKFAHYYSQPGQDISEQGTLYLFYTKSNNATVADIVGQTLAQFDGEQAKNMGDHILEMAQSLLGDSSTLVVRELGGSFQ